jgi:hypothetical protein
MQFAPHSGRTADKSDSGSEDGFGIGRARSTCGAPRGFRCSPSAWIEPLEAAGAHAKDPGAVFLDPVGVHDAGRHVAEVTGAELAEVPLAVLVVEEHVEDLVVGAVGVRRDRVALWSIHGEPINSQPSPGAAEGRVQDRPLNKSMT